MKISKLELINFKRFTHLVIDNIPDDAKLVLLIGANGSGKSSVFDGFDCISKGLENGYQYFMESAQGLIDYYRKNDNKEVNLKVLFDDGQQVNISNLNPGTKNNSTGKFIGRSSIRIIPRLTNTANVDAIKSNTDGPLTFIDNDTRFVNDVSAYTQSINEALREPFFQDIQTDTRKLFKEFIEPLNHSLKIIFEAEKNNGISLAAFRDATPGTPPQLIFQKGNSRINYDLLSHGEKQVIILLLNFIVRKKYYEEAIIFIDEMDSHLNTTLQERLLEEIVTRWIPDSSQLWTASHALGFIAYANKSKQAAIIDFDQLDFDTKQVLYPAPKENLELFEIAVPRESLQYILKATRLVVVENKNDEYYNLALAEKGYLFLPANNSREVFLTIKSDSKILGLRDRDYLKTEEIIQLREKFSNLKILLFYSFENYLYHPDNIDELNLKDYNKEEYIQEIRSAKNTELISIVSKIAIARQHYVEFKNGVKNEDNEIGINSITDELQKDDFDSFYPYFDMKKYYNRTYLQKFNLSAKKLVKTNWFKSRITEILMQ